MKKYLASLVLFVLCQMASQAQSNASLKVVMDNIKSGEGQIVISLYKPDSDFPDKPFKYVRVKKTGSSKLYYTFKDLAKGKYAVILLDDENEDNDMNYNFVGIPKEGFGFSNNVKPKMSTPKFSQCSFDVSGSASTTIKFIYY